MTSAKVLQVFNFANFMKFQLFTKYFRENFWHVTQFSHSDYKSVDGKHPGAKLPNPQGTPSKQIPSK